jgi:Protein of unknown function (DUF2423)
MAKGARASTRKRNNAALRAKVFGPAVDARTARLSAKLQELVSRPKPAEERAMEVDSLAEETKEQGSPSTANANLIDGEETANGKPVLFPSA